MPELYTMPQRVRLLARQNTPPLNEAPKRDYGMDSFDFYSSGGEYDQRKERKERERLAELKRKYESEGE